MAPRTAPVETDTELPPAADVVIIGGGIIGMSTAMFLAEQGLRVVVCEKGVVAGEQSSRNAGWVRQQGRDPREVALSMASLDLWRGIDARVDGDTGFRQCGSLYGFRTEAELSRYDAWVAKAKALGLESQVLDRDGVAAIAPGLERDYPIGLYTETDGRAEPQKAVPAITAYARRLGVTVLENCAVRAVEKTGGAISGVVTERGRIVAPKVVLAGGAWSSLFCRSLGLRLPQLKVIVSMQRTEALANGPDVAIWVPGICSRRRDDGGYTIENGGKYVADIVPNSFRFLLDYLPTVRREGKAMSLRLGRRFFKELGYLKPWGADGISPFEKERILDPVPDSAVMAAVPRLMAEQMPVFAGLAIAEQWGGCVDVTPDAIPVISPVEQVPGFFLSTGYSGHGFGLGLGAARLTADLVSGRDPIVDPHDFRFSRFSEKGGVHLE
ncbi:FAD-binding oxidoreductase [Devosia neptuniae]|uniref:FAD-binding oxidoreductase n=1 Tax=Devosia neptuniae TaxID=191302 RepID=A0ABY6CEL4_9HYPH|nr:FAD-binding oxidoreductase [Devosia neptuniae]UXN69431.1 FAD-binding oxidoreductase [Devosia neptuniae]